MNNVVEKPTNANDAYYMAHRAYDAENKELPKKYDYLAEVILNDPNLRNPGIVVWWSKNIKTHVDEMFNKLLDSYDVYAYADWFMEIDYYRNSELKLKVIKNNDVDEWINFIKNHYYLYTREDFYDNLPKEYQLGIVI